MLAEGSESLASIDRTLFYQTYEYIVRSVQLAGRSFEHAARSISGQKIKKEASATAANGSYT